MFQITAASALIADVFYLLVSSSSIMRFIHTHPFTMALQVFIFWMYIGFTGKNIKQ